MNINVTMQHVRMLAVPLASPFQLSFGTLHVLPRVLLELTACSGGQKLLGIGEAAIDFPFSDYDMWDVYQELTDQDLVGRRVEELLVLPCRWKAAQAAIDMAVTNLLAQREQKTISQLFSTTTVQPGRVVRSISFAQSLPDLDNAVRYAKRDGAIVKPKVGRSIEEDRQTINQLLHLSTPFWLDFNGKYSLDEFTQLWEQIRQLPVWTKHGQKLIALEQPVKRSSNASDLMQVNHLIKHTHEWPLPVIADEDVENVTEAILAQRGGLAVNLKVQKLGGLHQLLRLVHQTSETGLVACVGGTFPTVFGRAYDMHVAASLPITLLPSDAWLPASDYFPGLTHLAKEEFPAITAGSTTPPSFTTGLGVTPNWQKIVALSLSDPHLDCLGVRHGRGETPLRIDLSPGQSYAELYESRCGRPVDWNL